MKLIVGLGNPGKKYKNNRHNVGFMVMDYLIESVSQRSHVSYHKDFNSEIYKSEDKTGPVLFVKPQTFMNYSGQAVSKVATFYKIEPENIYVVHDDLDINLGEYKIQKATGPKVHGGILSVETSLGTKDFWRVRIGVDNRSAKNRIPGDAYVLQDFTNEERDSINKLFGEIKEKL